MSRVEVSIVDVYVVRPLAGGHLEFLLLQRSAETRCPGSWEAVHGHVEPGEPPSDAALRELREETGLAPDRLYNLSRVELFYQHRTDAVALVPVFVAVVAPGATPVLGPEHAAWEWLPPERARTRFAWPRERRALDDIAVLLPGGRAGAVEDVLRVC